MFFTWGQAGLDSFVAEINGIFIKKNKPLNFNISNSDDLEHLSARKMPNLKKSESIIFHCMGITFPSTVCIYYSMFSYAGWCEAGCFSVIFTNSYFFPCIFFYSSIFFGGGNSYIRESLLISVAEVNVDALKAFKAGFARVYFQEQVSQRSILCEVDYILRPDQEQRRDDDAE